MTYLYTLYFHNKVILKDKKDDEKIYFFLFTKSLSHYNYITYFFRKKVEKSY